jgi:thiol-disulfide isomerase/thioredoxin
MKHPLFPILACCLLLLVPAGARGGDRNLLRPMTVDGLKSLIAQPDKPRFLFFMASWCGPCRSELPTLERFYHAFGSKGLDLVGVSLDADPKNMQTLLDSSGVSFPVYWVGESAIPAFGLTNVPMLLIVRDGQVLQRVGARP